MSDSYRSVRKPTSEMSSFGIYTFSKSNFRKNKNLLIDISYNRSSNTAGLFFHLLSGANNDPFWHIWINCVIPWTYCCLTSGKHWPSVRKNLTKNRLKQSKYVLDDIKSQRKGESFSSASREDCRVWFKRQLHNKLPHYEGVLVDRTYSARIQ